MARSAFRMEELAAEEQAANSSRKVLYLNTESAFPFDVKVRGRYFIDNAHMSDAGQDRIGDLFAKAILKVAPFPEDAKNAAMRIAGTVRNFAIYLVLFMFVVLFWSMRTTKCVSTKPCKASGRPTKRSSILHQIVSL